MGSNDMEIQTQFGYTLVLILATAIIFYTIGYSTGRKDGHKLGRSLGIRIGERRASDRRVSQ
jgi:hypothetical protein